MPDRSDAPNPGSRTDARPRGSWWGAPALLVPLLTGILLSWHSLGDLDIWFHLRAGRDLLAGRGIVAGNVFSFTEPDHPWVNHEWMFQALTALTGPGASGPADSGGEPRVLGWNLLRAALTLVLLLVLVTGDGGWARLRGKFGAAAAAWSGVPVLAGLLLIWPRLTIRPELFSYLFFVLLIRAVEKVFHPREPAPSGRPGHGPPPPVRPTDLLDPRRPAGRLVLMTVVWAQFHGFAALVPAVLLAGWILSPLQSRLTRTGVAQSPPVPGWRGPLLIALSVAALTLTPNGPAGLLMPLRALGQFSQTQVDLRTTVSELAPLQESPNSLFLTITAYRLGLIWGLIWIAGTFGRISLVRILVFALAAVAAWNNQRSIGFFGLAFILLHAGAGPRPWRFAVPGRPLKRLGSALPAAGLVLTLLAGGLLWPRIVNDDFYLREGVGRRFGAGVTPSHFPFEAAGNLARRPAPSVFANLDAAAFLLGTTTARLYVDGRTEAYSADLWAEYRTIKAGGETALGILDRREVEWVCLATGSGAFGTLAQQLLASDRWQLVGAEGAGLLYRPGPRAPGTRSLLEQAARSTLAHAGETSTARGADFCLAAGRLFEFAGNARDREAAYRRGLDLKDNHPALNHNLGNLLLDRRAFAEALTHFQKALEMNPRLVGSALNAGVCQMRLGNPADAARSFARAAALDPDRFEAWVNLSSACLASGQRQKAVKALARALEIRPGDRQLQQRMREIGGR